MPQVEVTCYKFFCNNCGVGYHVAKGKATFKILNPSFWRGMAQNGWKFDQVANVYLCRKCKPQQ